MVSAPCFARSPLTGLQTFKPFSNPAERKGGPQNSGQAPGLATAVRGAEALTFDSSAVPLAPAHGYLASWALLAYQMILQVSSQTFLLLINLDFQMPSMEMGHCGAVPCLENHDFDIVMAKQNNRVVSGSECFFFFGFFE